MKLTIKIARAELANLFYSPIAWLVLALFTVQATAIFLTAIEFHLTNQVRGVGGSMMTNAMYARKFGPAGLFAGIQQYLYLYVPLLTMGLMSRELGSGAIKLLLSSPVRISEIVLGKFAAMMAFGLVLIAALVPFGVVGFFSIEAMDVPFVLLGLLGLYLLICAYAAIGLFVSSLTSYQAIAAIGTLAILAALTYIGGVGQQFDLVRDVTYFLSIGGRADDLISGLISSKDIVYFLVVIGLSLGLTILKLRSGRESKPIAVHASRYFILGFAAVLVVYISSRPIFRHYHDVTRTEWQTLTEDSQGTVKQIAGPLKITTYVNILSNYFNVQYGLPKLRNVDLSKFEQYMRFLPKLETEYVYYYDTPKDKTLYNRYPELGEKEIAEMMADSFGLNFDKILSPEEIAKRIDLAPEENRVTRLVEYGGKGTFLRMFDDMLRHPGECEVTAALKRLIGSPVTVGFVTGHGERTLGPGDANYRTAARELTYRSAMINQGFDVMPISLSKDNIPPDIDVLVLADPRRDLTTEAVQMIWRYIEAGGNMIVAGEAESQQFLNPVMSPLGVQLTGGPLLRGGDSDSDLASDFILAEIADIAANLSDSFIVGAEAKAVSKVPMPGAVRLSWSGTAAYMVRPLLTVESVSTLADEEGKDAITVAASLTRQLGEKEQRIVVLGDADFMSSRELDRYLAAKNDFYLDILKWLSYDKYPVDCRRPQPEDITLLVDRDDLFRLRLALMGIVPGLIVLFGGVILIKRRRK